MIKGTIVEYPDRGNYGDNKYRGNCSGFLLRDLFEYYKPQKVFDPMAGSGTTGAVAAEMGIECVQLDLNPKYGGWDALSGEIDESSDFIFFHPPYHDIIKYSSVYYQYDPRDLSQCPTYGDFICKLNAIQEKLLYSLRRGGRMAVLVGDVKRQGRLYSIQKDMDWFGSPETLVIKRQFNTWSGRQRYAGKFIPIEHEYLMIFKRDDCYIIPRRIVTGMSEDIRNSGKVTWKDLVFAAVQKLGGRAALIDIYEELKDSKRCKDSQFWREKIRQVLQIYKDFKKIDKGVYAVAA